MVVRAFACLLLLVSSIVFAGGPSRAADGAAPAPGGNLTCTQGLGGIFFVSAACKPLNRHRGVVSSFANENLYMHPALVAEGGMVKHAIWTMSGDPCGSAWAESGLVYGGEGGSAYYWFYAWKELPVNGGQYHSSSALAYESPNPQVTHRYQLRYGATVGGVSYYELTRENTQTPIQIPFQGVGSCVSNVGLAANKTPDENWSTGTFNATSTYWLDWPDGFLHSDFGYESYVHFPCGSNPNCFNGVYRGIDWWSSNKL